MDKVNWNLELDSLRKKKRQVRNFPARKSSPFVEFRLGLPGAGHREVFLNAAIGYQHLREMPPHSNVIRVIEWVDNDVQGGPGFHVLLESFSSLTLKDYLQTHHRVPPKCARTILFQLFRGVGHCHTHDLLHGDIRPENILINPDTLDIKLTGFDVARPLWSLPVDPVFKLQCISGSMLYQSPELLLDGIRNIPQVDIWAIGCLFAEMLTGRVLFQGDESNSPYEQLKSVFRVLATPGEPEVGDIIKSFNEGSFNLTSEILLAYNSFSKYAPFDLSEAMSDGLKGLGSWGLDLLSRMLNMNFRERISIESALCHRYFSANALEEVEFEFRLVRNYSLRVGYNNKFAPKDRMMILSAANGLSCLQHLPSHPNIISIDGWFNEDVAGKRSGFQVITRYKWTRTLRTYMQRRRDMGEIHRVMLQLLSGVAHCHAHGVVHGDLRPENVTVDHTTGDLQLSEFDMASRMPPLDLDIHIGRPENFLYYQAPELLLGDTANPAASDIWSVGCIFAEMLLGAKVLFRDSKSEQIATIFSSPNLPPETLPLLSRMLAMNPADRFSAVDCLFDSFFKSLKCRSLDGMTH